MQTDRHRRLRATGSTRPAGRCSRARSPPAAPASSAKNARTKESAVARLVRRTVVAPGPAWRGRRRSRSAAIARIRCRTRIASTAPSAPPTRRAVEAARRRSPRARAVVRTTAASGPTSAAAARSRDQRRNLHRPSRPGTGLRYVGQLRRQPRLLRPDHERVHQPDRRGRRLLGAGRPASLTQPATERRASRMPGPGASCDPAAVDAVLAQSELRHDDALLVAATAGGVPVTTGRSEVDDAVGVSGPSRWCGGRSGTPRGARRALGLRAGWQDIRRDVGLEGLHGLRRRLQDRGG